MGASEKNPPQLRSFSNQTPNDFASISYNSNIEKYLNNLSYKNNSYLKRVENDWNRKIIIT